VTLLRHLEARRIWLRLLLALDSSSISWNLSASLAAFSKEKHRNLKAGTNEIERYYQNYEWRMLKGPFALLCTQKPGPDLSGHRNGSRGLRVISDPGRKFEA
jgi:hypothetical protein